MSDHTHIEWTDATWNPITGCSMVSTGCKNCYAMRLAGTRLRHHPSRARLTRTHTAGPVWTGEVRLNQQWLDQPLRWRKPRRIFVCAHGDLFHQAVPDKWIDRVFAVMALAPQHTFQVLTKRPGRMQRWVRLKHWKSRQHGQNTWPLPNVWLGTSVEDQATADERIPLLLQAPAAVRFISAEPLLGPVGLARHFPHVHGMRNDRFWVIAGGESGPGARPAHPEWFRSLRDQCQRADVPFFFKQWGEWQVASVANGHFSGNMETNGARWVHNDGLVGGPSSLRFDRRHGTEPYAMKRVGKRAAGHLLDGRAWQQFPGPA